MKLFSKEEAQSKSKKEEETLIRRNNNLLKYFQTGVKKLNDMKDDYSQDKMNKQRDFNNFCTDLLSKKSELLQEYAIWEKKLEEKKDMFYELVERQDALQDKESKLNEREKTLKLREDFNKETEEQIKRKWDEILKLK